MTDLRSPSPPRGLRIGAVSVLVAIALLLGLVMGVVLVRRQVDRGEIAPPQALSQPAAPAAVAPTPVAPRVDAGMLAAREIVLAGQLAGLEARTAALTATADTAGNQAGRAEALLTAIAARRALDRGMGLGALEAQLIRRFGASAPQAVAVVREAARQPVTLEELRQALDAVGPAAAAGASDGWPATLRRELSNLVVLRHAGTPSPRPAEHLARAQHLLEADQVEAALAEVALLPGVDDAANWRAAAGRYIAARHALDTLETVALAGPPPPARVPTP